MRQATVVKLHQVDGLTYRQIADQLGITPGRVSQIMDAYGAKRRPRGRPANVHPCTATKRDGTPCHMKVKVKGSRCWIHNRRKKIDAAD